MSRFNDLKLYIVYKSLLVAFLVERNERTGIYTKVPKITLLYSTTQAYIVCVRLFWSLGGSRFTILNKGIATTLNMFAQGTQGTQCVREKARKRFHIIPYLFTLECFKQVHRVSTYHMFSASPP